MTAEVKEECAKAQKIIEDCLNVGRNPQWMEVETILAALKKVAEVPVSKKVKGE